MLGENFINILTKEEDSNFEFGRINIGYLKKKINNFQQHFYICGPDVFVTDITKLLTELGASTESVVFEK